MRRKEHLLRHTSAKINNVSNRENFLEFLKSLRSSELTSDWLQKGQAAFRKTSDKLNENHSEYHDEELANNDEGPANDDKGPVNNERGQPITGGPDNDKGPVNNNNEGSANNSQMWTESTSSHCYTQIRVDLHSLLDEYQGRLLAVGSDLCPNHDQSGFLMSEVAQHVDPEAAFAGSKHSVIVDVVHGLHGEKLFVCPQDQWRCAIVQDFQDLTCSLQTLGLGGLR